MKLDLTSRAYLITGAARGLGAAYARMLCLHGAKVMVNDIDAGASRDAAQTLRDQGFCAGSDSSDISDWDGAHRAVADTHQAFGRLDGLICNAGFLRDRSFHKMSRAEIDDIVKVHLMGAIYPVRAAWPILRDKGFGRIVFTASSSSLWGNFGQANYDAAKGGLCGLMNALKLEGAGHGICVNTVAPLAGTRLATDLFERHNATDMPTEQVAGIVSYLCSPECRESGEVYEAGGGFVARVGTRQSEPVVTDLSRPADAAAALETLHERPLTRAYSDATQSVEEILRRVEEDGWA
ncbi:SDR family NAD(P)-dependent oxidoreductase [Sulfitobacter sp. MOLA879]|uniref:SDR family NAD(P)-dependent oxidoreductase n=1 Tax=Sulfitobacter sp. MOLA879 TaxID=3368579 RepID=UPI003744D480